MENSILSGDHQGLKQNTALVRAFSDDFQQEMYGDGPHRTLIRSLSLTVQQDREREQRLARLSLEWPLLFADVDHLSQMYGKTIIPQPCTYVNFKITVSLSLKKSNFYDVVQNLLRPGRSSNCPCRKGKGLYRMIRHPRSPYYPASSNRPPSNGKRSGIKVHGAK